MLNRLLALSGIFLSLILSTCLGAVVRDNSIRRRQSPNAKGPDHSAAGSSSTVSSYIPGYTYAVTPGSLRYRDKSGTYVSAPGNPRVLCIGSTKAEDDHSIYVAAWDMATTSSSANKPDLHWYPLSEVELGSTFAYNNVEVVLASVKMKGLKLSTGTQVMGAKVAEHIRTWFQEQVDSEEEVTAEKKKKPQRSSVQQQKRKPSPEPEARKTRPKKFKEARPVKGAGTLCKSSLQAYTSYSIQPKFIKVILPDGSDHQLKYVSRRVLFLGAEMDPHNLFWIKARHHTEGRDRGREPEVDWIDGSLVGLSRGLLALVRVADGAEFNDAQAEPTVNFEKLIRIVKSKYAPSIDGDENLDNLTDNEGGMSEEENEQTSSAQIEALFTPGIPKKVAGHMIQKLRNDGEYVTIRNRILRLVVYLGKDAWPHRYVIVCHVKKGTTPASNDFRSFLGFHPRLGHVLYFPVKILDGASPEDSKAATLQFDIEEINNLVNSPATASSPGGSST